MYIDTDKFRFSSVRPCFLESQEVVDGQRKAPVVSGIASTEIECKACNHKWTAVRQKDASFRLIVGGALVTCPSCRTNDVVNDEKVALSASKRGTG